MSKCKNIKGHEHYVIYDDGRILNTKFNKFLNPYKDTVGYYSVVLCKNGKRSYCRLHRLLAEYFIENPENKPQVNHKDADRLNYSISNLEWCTSKENVNHAMDNNLMHPKAPSPESNYKKILRSDGIVYKSLTEAASLNKTHLSSISKCLSGLRKTHHGFQWTYVTM